MGTFTDKERYLAWLLGQEMKKSQGKADPRVVYEELKEKMEES